MIQPYSGKKPRFGAGCRIHESAVIIGDVELGEEVSVWPGAVLRADYGPIKIGRGSNVQDGAVIHEDVGAPALIGDDCVVGHQACIHGAKIGNRCLIGIHAVLLNGCEIGDESIIGSGAVVSEGKKIPPRSLVLGVPGKVTRPTTDEDVMKIQQNARDYRGYALRQLPLAGTK
jgi:carbonic anhydrase/acetyltransferase-like protein (isoleucine patch superfamily)